MFKIWVWYGWECGATAAYCGSRQRVTRDGAQSTAHTAPPALSTSALSPEECSSSSC